MWGNGSIAPPFLTSALDGGESTSHPRERVPGALLDRRFGEPQSHSRLSFIVNNNENNMFTLKSISKTSK
jgi:hypothetical protein